jgi:hypothetical protein
MLALNIGKSVSKIPKWYFTFYISHISYSSFNLINYVAAFLILFVLF